MNNEIKVSVLCLAYNHEKYIRECLDSILNQKTSFKFEIIINDDASTDRTAEIIKEYENKYPEQIRPIYQQENKYSKGVAIIEECILERAAGKYVAFCECDDKWLDENKLQLQYDYMENHLECSMCTHNTLIHDLNHIQEDMNFNSWDREHILNEREVFMDWKVHTSSYFVRKEDAYRPVEYRKYWFGDYVRLTMAYTEGKVVALPAVMSQYNYGVASGELKSVDSSKIEARKEKVLDRKRYLEQLDQATERKFHKIINERILVTQLEAESLRERDVLTYSHDKKEVMKAAKSIVKKSAYKKYISSLSGMIKVKELIRYRGYVLYPAWVKIWKK